MRTRVCVCVWGAGGRIDERGSGEGSGVNVRGMREMKFFVVSWFTRNVHRRVGVNLSGV